MKRHMLLLAFALGFVFTVSAQTKIAISDITKGKFSAQTISGMIPIEGTDQYAQISDDRTQIVQYSFKTGKQTAVLFDLRTALGAEIDRFDGYIASPDYSKLLIRTNRKMIYRRSYTADFYVYDVKTHYMKKLSNAGVQQVPTWSPNGEQVAFVRDNNLFIKNVNDNRDEVQVTYDGKFNEIINGIPDWVYEEEFGYNCAYTFTADGKMLCWVKFNETDVPVASLQQFKGMKPEKKEYSEYPGLYSYKYPKAGEQNSTVSVWAYDIATQTTSELPVPLDNEGYIPRILPTTESDKIIVYTMNRHQDDLRIYAVNPRTKVCKQLIREQTSCYVKEEAMENIRIGKSTILLPSDRDGFMKVYIYDKDGKQLRSVGGNFDITDIYGYDEKTGDVFYQAAIDGALDRQILVTHKNGKTQRLSNQKGWNSALFSADCRYFVNTWSDRNHPYEYTTRDSQGKLIAKLLDNDALKQRTVEYGFTDKELFSFTTGEGVQLNGWMIRPADFDATKKYPVILHQYSGPGSQQVKDSWGIGSMGNGGAFDYYMAQHGYIVVCVDGRGTGGRGSEFEKCTYLKLGDLESKDQVETAIYLASLPYIDKDRIGIWGWSYGGFNTLMSMSEGREVFKAGVAIAPPTNWKYYDSVYTERFMRTPKENSEGYDRNPISRAKNLHGALLICHGVADDNVHPQNTYEYSEALVQADKDFKELLYTNRNHSIYGGNTRTHLLRQVANWFIENL